MLLSVIVFVTGVLSSTIVAFSQEEKASPSVIEAVILIDESDSMKGMNGTDPMGMRYISASLILEYLALHSELNSASVVFWGTYPDEREFRLTRDLVELSKRLQLSPPFKEPSCRVQELEGLPLSYLDLKQTPLGCFTDFLLALNRAESILESSPESISYEGKVIKKLKYVFIITDGNHDPWPGHSRFGDLAKRFKEYVSEKKKNIHGYNFMTDENKTRWRNEAVNLDRESIERILEKYRERGWKVHVLAVCKNRDVCDRNINEEFIHMLANETNGEARIAYNEEDIVRAIRDILPPTSQLLIYPLDRDKIMCDGVFVPFRIGRGSHLDKFKMFIHFGRIGGVRSDNLRVKIVSPSGKEYTPEESVDNFRIYGEERREGRERKEWTKIVIFEMPSPEEGEWKVSVVAKENEHLQCAELELFGKRNQKVVVNIECVNKGLCEPGRETEVALGLYTLDGHPLPFNNARCKISGRGEEFEVPLEMISTTIEGARATTAARGRVQLPSREGMYKVLCEITEPALPKPVIDEVNLDIKEVPIACRYPEETIIVGRVGFSEKERCAEREIYINCEEGGGRTLEPRISFLRGNATNYEIMNGKKWVSFPSRIRVAPNQKFPIRVCLPSNVDISEIPNDVYKGEIEFVKTGGRVDFTIPVEFELKVPDTQIIPNEIIFNYRFHSLKDVLKKNIVIETSAFEEIEGKLMVYRFYQKGQTGKIVKEVELSTSPEYKRDEVEEGEDSATFVQTVKLLEKKKIPLFFKLKGPSIAQLEKEFEGKELVGEIFFESPSAKGASAKIIIKIPKKRFPKKFLYILTGFLGFMMILFQRIKNKRLLRKCEKVIENKPEEIVKRLLNYDRNNKMVRINSQWEHEGQRRNYGDGIELSEGSIRFNILNNLGDLIEIDKDLKRIKNPSIDDYRNWEVEVRVEEGNIEVTCDRSNNPLSKYYDDLMKEIRRLNRKKYIRKIVFIAAVMVIIYLLP